MKEHEVWDERYDSILPKENAKPQQQKQQQQARPPAQPQGHRQQRQELQEQQQFSQQPVGSSRWAQRALILSVSCVSAGAFATAAGGVLPVTVAAGSVGFTLGLLSSILGIRVGRWVA